MAEAMAPPVVRRASRVLASNSASLLLPTITICSDDSGQGKANGVHQGEQAFQQEMAIRRKRSAVPGMPSVAGLELPSFYDTDTVVQAPVNFDVRLPEGSPVVLMLNPDIEAREVKALAVAKMAACRPVGGTVDATTMVLYLAPDGQAPVLLADGAKPYRLYAKDLRQVAAMASVVVPLRLAWANDDHMELPVYVAKNVCVQMRIAVTSTAEDLVGKARPLFAKYSHVQDCPPLVLALAIEGRSDRVLGPHEQPCTLLKRVLESNPDIAPETVKFVVREEARVSSGGHTSSHGTTQEDLLVYHLAVRAVVAVPDTLQEVAATDVAVPPPQRRKSLFKAQHQLTAQDINTLRAKCAGQVRVIMEPLGDLDYSSPEAFDLQSKEVQDRVYALALAQYHANFLCRNASRFAQMNDTSVADFVRIFEKTARATLTTHLMAQVQLSENQDSKASKSKEKQQGRLVAQWVGSFKDLLAESIGRVLDAGDLDAASDSLEALEDEEAAPVNMLDWNTVTGGRLDGTLYSDQFNRAMHMLRTALQLTEDDHKQRVLAEMERINSHPTDILQQLKLRLAVAMQNMNPSYNPTTMDPVGYQMWQQREASGVQQLVASIKANHKWYISLLRAKGAMGEADSTGIANVAQAFRATLQLTVLEARGLRRCSNVQVSARLGGSQADLPPVPYSREDGKGCRWGDGATLNMVMEDPAMDVQLLLEDTEEVDGTEVRRCVAAMQTPMDQLVSRDAATSTLVVSDRWYALQPKGELRLSISLSIGHAGLRLASNCEVAEGELLEDGWHHRYLLVLLHPMQCSFEFFAPSSHHIQELTQKAEEEKCSSGDWDAVVDVAAALPQVAEVLRQGPLEQLMDPKADSWEPVYATLDGVKIVLAGMQPGSDEKDLDLTGAFLDWSGKYKNHTVFTLRTVGLKLRLRGSSTEETAAWYVAIQNALGALRAPGVKHKPVRSRSTRVKEMALSFSFKRDIRGSRKSKDSKATLQAPLSVGNDHPERKNSVFDADLLPPSVALAQDTPIEPTPASTENEAEAMEAYVAARRTKGGRLVTQGFSVTANEGVLKIRTLEAHHLDIRLPGPKDTERWGQQLQLMASRLLANRYQTHSTSQLRAAADDLQRHIQEGQDDQGPLQARMAELAYVEGMLQDALAKGAASSSTDLAQDEGAEGEGVVLTDIQDHHSHLRHLIYLLHPDSHGPTGQWLLERFGLLYGVYPTYRRLAVLDHFARMYSGAPDMEAGLLPALLEDCKTLQDLRVRSATDTSLVTPEGYSVTRGERQLLGASMAMLDAVLATQLTRYRENFPYGKGGLHHALALFAATARLKHLLRTSGPAATSAPMDPTATSTALRKCVKSGAKDRYERRRGDSHLHGLALVNQACGLVGFVAEDLQDDQAYYQQVLAGMLDLLACNLHTYGQLLQPDIASCVALDTQQQTDAGLLRLYLLLVRLQTTHAGAEGGLQTLLLLFEGPVRAWVAGSRTRLLQWCSRALADDALVPETGESLHSASVVDLFCLISEAYGFVQKLAWPEPLTRADLLRDIARAACDAVRSYLDHLWAMVQAKFLSPQSITYGLWRQPKFFVCMNNVDMALHQQEVLLDSVRTEIADAGTAQPFAVGEFGDDLHHSKDVRDRLVREVLKGMESVMHRYMLGLFEASNRDSHAGAPGQGGDVDDALVGRKLAGLMDYLDEKLEIMHTHLYRSLFGFMLKGVWALACRCLQDLVDPRRGAKVHHSLGEALTPRQYIICTRGLLALQQFFNADGNGLDLELLKSVEYQECMAALAHCSASTEELVKEYEREVANPQEKELLVRIIRRRTRDIQAVRYLRKIGVAPEPKKHNWLSKLLD